MTTSANPDRVRLNQTALRSEDDVNQALYEYGLRKTKIEIWKARGKAIVAAIKFIIQGKVDALAEQNNLTRLQVAEYLRAHEGDFHNPRSKTLTFGTVGFRKQIAKADFDDDEADRIMDAIEATEGEQFAETRCAMKITITGTWNELAGTVKVLRTVGLGDHIERGINKTALKALPEPELTRLGIEMDATSSAPFFTPNNGAIIETARINPTVEPMQQPTLYDVNNQLRQMFAAEEEA